MTPHDGLPPTVRDSADVGRLRERRRQRRLLRVAVVLAPVAVFLWYRIAVGDAFSASDLPSLPAVDPLYLMVGVFFALMVGVLLAQVLVSGRSPHLVYRPEQIDVTLDDVKGLGPVKEEVTRSLDLFLAGRTFRREMGGTPRRGLLFEGPPGTGKTHLAKAMAREAGVPFLYVSGTSFQSMYYGATARKIRSYFRALRTAARKEGGAIGFIEEVDAIATVRSGMPMAPGALAGTATASATAGATAGAVTCCGGLTGLPLQARSAREIHDHGGVGRGMVVSGMTSEGVGGVVNELLVQMQSFDQPTGAQKLLGGLTDAVNLLLPAHRQLRRPRVEPVDVLLIAATNRADSLDPALLRPGRFDRRLTFDAPDQAGRREVLDHYLARKSHGAELDDDERRDALAGITAGSTPVQIENLLDEALVNAVRRGAPAMSWKDVEHARLVTSVGLGSPVGYTEREARLIATHEAGHAVVAHLVAPTRRLEVLTIVKRAGALGLLAHGDAEEVWTRSRSELLSLVQIAFGGQVAEELAFGEVSTGPSSDLAYATRVAAQMVGSAGMAGTLVSFAAAESSPMGEGLVARVLGDAGARAQVEQLLTEQRDAVRALLRANTHRVAALRDALLERHELVGHEITDVLAAAGPPAPTVAV